MNKLNNRITSLPASLYLQFRWTGILGMVLFVLTLIEVPLYFVYSGAPSVNNVLTRVLLNIVLIPGLVAFYASFRHIVITANAKYEWLATFLLLLVAMHGVQTLVANSMEGGLAIATGHNIDPTIAANASYLLYGSIGRVMTTLFLCISGYLVIATHVIPKWIGYLAYMLALYSAAFIPSMFFGNNPSHFYSANGWGTTALGASSIMYWVLAASIVFLVRSRRPDISS